MYRKQEAKRAFGQGVREGKGKMYFGATLRYKTKPTKAGPVEAMSEEEKAMFPDVWASMKEAAEARLNSIVEMPEGPYKRLSPEQESIACRELRIYKKCSRNCTPNPLFGCKGWRHFSTCPQPPEPEFD